MRVTSVLCVLMICASASSAAAQYGGFDSDEVKALKGINQSLDDISLEMSLDSIRNSSPSLSDAYGGYGGVVYVYQHPIPTRSQWKHYYRAQHAELVRAGTVKARKTYVTHSRTRF